MVISVEYTGNLLNQKAIFGSVSQSKNWEIWSQQ